MPAMNFCPTRGPSQHTYEAPSSVAGYDGEIFEVFYLVNTFLNRKAKSGVEKVVETELVSRYTIYLPLHTALFGFTGNGARAAE